MTYETIDHWIDTVGLVCMVTGFVTYPVLVLIHELGHARAAIRLGERPTVLLVGPYPPIFHHRFKRLDIHWHPIIFGGVCAVDDKRLTVAEMRQVLNGGTHATVVFGFICAGLAAILAGDGGIPFYLAAAGFLVSIFVTLNNLVSRRDEFGGLTDGGQLRILAKLPSDARRPRPSRSQPPPGSS